MSNVPILPLIQVAGSVENNEDLTFSLTFTLADGVTSIPLAGIQFTIAVNYPAGANLFTGSTSDSVLTIGGASGNVLSCTIREAVTSTWPIGGYSMTLIATDGTATKGVFADSSLVVGETQAWTFTTVMPSGATAVGTTNSGELWQAPVLVAASQNITASGTYIVTQTGVTMTLNPASTINGEVIVKDMTGNSDPNIVIAGPIDGGSSLTLNAAYQSVTLLPVSALSLFANIS